MVWLHMALCWLGSCKHGARRFNGTKSDKGYRIRSELPESQMFAQQIQQLGLDPSTLLHFAQDQGKATQIVGLVSATLGVLNGDLAQWSAEASLHWEYFARPLDAFTININIAKPMPAPVAMLARLRMAFKQCRGDTTGVSIGNAYFFASQCRKRPHCCTRWFGNAKRPH